MKDVSRAFAFVTAATMLVGISSTATAQTPTPKNFQYTVTVKTPSDTKTANAAVSVVQTGATSYVLTLTPTGQPAKNIPLTVTNGTIVIAPQAGAAIANDSGARGLVANLELAFASGLQAKAHGVGGPISVPFSVTPVGNGAAVSAVMTMTPAATENGGHDFTGSTQASTTTILPESSGGRNPKGMAASGAIGLIAGPVGGIVAGGIIRHKEKQVASSAASSAHPDTISVSARSRFGYGKLLAVIGTQTDHVNVSGHEIVVTSNWTLSAQ